MWCPSRLSGASDRSAGRGRTGCLNPLGPASRPNVQSADIIAARQISVEESTVGPAAAPDRNCRHSFVQAVCREADVKTV